MCIRDSVEIIAKNPIFCTLLKPYFSNFHTLPAFLLLYGNFVQNISCLKLEDKHLLFETFLLKTRVCRDDCKKPDFWNLKPNYLNFHTLPAYLSLPRKFCTEQFLFKIEWKTFLFDTFLLKTRICRDNCKKNLIFGTWNSIFWTFTPSSGLRTTGIAWDFKYVSQGSTCNICKKKNLRSKLFPFQGFF